MRCIVFGHTPREFQGAGQFSGQKFKICTECGATWNAETGEREERTPVAFAAPETETEEVHGTR